MPGRQRGAWFIALPRRMQEKAVLWEERKVTSASAFGSEFLEGT